MSFRNVVNDGSSKPPRLRIQAKFWALTGLPRGGPEWSDDEKLDRIVAAGYSGFEAFSANVEPLRARGLEYGYSCAPRTADDLVAFIDAAKRARADHLHAKVHGSLRSLDDIVAAVRAMYDRASAAGLPLFLETHRGCVTQDLRRTLDLINEVPHVRFTGDISHYIIAGEVTPPWNEEVRAALGRIVEHCCSYHARVSNGEQVQIDIGPEGAHPAAQEFVKLWTRGIGYWLSQARPGDVLPFTIEPGPPPYSILDLQGREMYDRWAQGRVLKHLVEQAWDAAHASS